MRQREIEKEMVKEEVKNGKTERERERERQRGREGEGRVHASERHR